MPGFTAIFYMRDKKIMNRLIAFIAITNTVLLLWFVIISPLISDSTAGQPGAKQVVQLQQRNISLDRRTPVTGVAIRDQSPEGPTHVLSNRNDNNEKNITQPGAESTTTADNQSQQIPEDAQVIRIDLTPKQTTFYENYKKDLNDPSFLWNLNLQKFVSQPEYKSLPDNMKMFIISQLMEKLSKGEIDREKFLGRN